MPKKQTPKVLVFEDLDNNYALLQPKIESAGYRPVRARSPEEFETHTPWKQYVLIIMDLFVGEGPSKRPAGIELTRSVRKKNKRIPIIVASKLEPDRFDVAECFRAGANDYVDKAEIINDTHGILARHLAEAEASSLRAAEAEFPLPIAFLLRDYRRSKTNPRQRLERLIELFEVTLKLVAYSLIGASLDQIRNLKPDLREAFGRPSLGHLQRMIDALPATLTPLHAIAERAHRQRFREITGTLINVRNDYIGHGGTRSEAVYEKQLEIHEHEVMELLDMLQEFREMRIVSPLRPKLLSGNTMYEYPIQVFAGSNPDPEMAELRTNLVLQEKVYLLDVTEEHAVALDPFCQYLVCDDCLQKKLFLYRLARQGELWMIDHVYGHAIQTQSGWQTYHDLFEA